MHPVICSLGPFTLYTYGLLLVVAFGVSTWLARRDAGRLPPARRAIAADQLPDFAALALLGGIVGARLLYVALQWREFAAAPLEVFAIWHGGLVWYGGFAGGLLAGWWYVRRRRLAWLSVMDQLVPFAALGHAIGRLGCFFNGCCYGRPTEAWFGVRFPGLLGPVVPTQLLEAGGLLLLCFFLRAKQRDLVVQARRSGSVFGVYLVSYGVLRFLIELARGDQARWHGLTLPQLVSLGLIIAGEACLGRAARRPSRGTGRTSAGS